jgi:hypothetical protein
MSKSLRLSKDKVSSYRSNRPIFEGNARTLNFDMKEFQLSSPTHLKKNQLVISHVMRDHSKPKDLKKFNIGEGFDKDKKEDSFLQFKLGKDINKIEFDPEHMRKLNRKSFLNR